MSNVRLVLVGISNWNPKCPIISDSLYNSQLEFKAHVCRSNVFVKRLDKLMLINSQVLCLIHCTYLGLVWTNETKIGKKKLLYLAQNDVPKISGPY